ncbi:heparinase II/III family protein [Cellulomonas cellasea]|uniref:Heparinase II/III-like C-terminal domain-containing protein n=1 Tax=Cellulomonas cellasea TaxID=43670 RepID=A0A7W4YB99_9CELL|nr:heparinase II/III family protein [Cellulomonas cellasea]MBB2922809.1 hypothetical protein [Cellulomonas cellasea]
MDHDRTAGTATVTPQPPAPAPAPSDAPTGPLLRAWGPDARRDRLTELLARGLRAHPVRPVHDRALWDAVDQPTVAAFRLRGELDLEEPWPQPLTSHYARYLRDGNRTAYEDQVARRQERLSRAAVLATATGEERWLDEVADGVVLLCEQSSWCWPAHDEGLRIHGWALPPEGSPSLDLGAAEVVGQLAWIDHTLGAALDDHAPGVRERLRAEARSRVLRPFVDRRDWHWLRQDGWAHNWNPWIHGHVLVAALALLDEPDERAEAVEHAIAGLDQFLDTLPTDGSSDEGYTSWWNGAGRALEALEVLAHASGGVLDASSVPVVRETVRFPHRMQLGGDWYLDVADSPARPPRDQAWHVLHRWAQTLDDEQVRLHAASYREPGLPSVTERAGLGRALQGLADPAWRDAHREHPPLERDVWLPQTQLVVTRERLGSARGLCVTVKGGHNGEHDNHNDVGSVVIAVDGVPLVVDAGQPTYTAATFGAERFTLWTMQSSWHNVPEPAWTTQGTGARYRARDVRVTPGEDTTRVVLDLSEAYDLPGATGLRTVVLDRRRRCVTVEDAWDLGRDGRPGGAGTAPADGSSTVDASGTHTDTDAAGRTDVGSPAGLRVHYLLAGEVSAERGGVVTRPASGGRGVRLTWDPETVVATTTVRLLDDPLLAGVWGERLTRLELTLTEPAAGAARAVARAGRRTRTTPDEATSRMIRVMAQAIR